MALTLLLWVFLSSLLSVWIGFHSQFIPRRVPLLTAREQTTITGTTCFLIYILRRGNGFKQESWASPWLDHPWALDFLVQAWVDTVKRVEITMKVWNRVLELAVWAVHSSLIGTIEGMNVMEIITGSITVIYILNKSKKWENKSPDYLGNWRKYCGTCYVRRES